MFKRGLNSYANYNSDGIYNPLDGDYAVITNDGCIGRHYADQMIYLIYNYNGGTHGNSGGIPRRLEVYQLSFDFKTDNDIKNMTFHKFILFNRSPSNIDSMIFGLWIDPELGCADDDLIGCSPDNNLTYVYNQDATDGITGYDCSSPIGSTATYYDQVPIVEIDILHA